MDKLKKVVITIPKGNLIVSSVAGAYKLFKAAIEESGEAIDLIIAGVPNPGGYLDGLFSIYPSVHWQDIEDADLIIIPAVVDKMDAVIAQNEDYLEWIKAQYSRQTVIASLCTGSFLLAAAGLLKNKKATTHWAYSQAFNKDYPEVNFQHNNIITEDEGILTSGGAYSFLNLIIYLIERFFDKEIARKLINVFQIDYIRTSQDRFVIFDTQKRHDDEQIKAIQDHIETHFAKTISTEDLAKIGQLGERTMIRRFKKITGNTPKQYQMRVRIEAAKDLLFSSNKQIQEIQYEVGYNDPKFFRASFLKHTGMLPKAYRSTMARV